MSISDEEKAILGITRQALITAIDSLEWRWLLCWDGEDSRQAFDCACCLTWEKHQGCQCICHKRIKDLDRTLYASLRTIQAHQNSWWRDRGIDGKKHEPNG